MKIPCVALVYAQFDVMKQSIQSLNHDDMSISIVENPSPITLGKSMPFFLEMLKNKKIEQYFVFHDNIRFNAIETVIRDGQINLSNSDYVITTDADIVVDSRHIDEQKIILESDPNILCCSVQIDFSGYPTEGYNSAQRWFPPRVKETELYIAMQGYGHHLNMFRKKDFLDFFEFLKKHKKSYVDSELMEYIQSQGNKLWAITRNNLGKHLTPALERNLNETFYLWSRNTKDQNTLWKHSNYSGYTKFELNLQSGDITCHVFEGINHENC